MANSTLLDITDTHRLIPTRFAAKESSVLETLPLHHDVLADLSELDAATNERKRAENGENIAITPAELLYGVPEAHIVNAAFTHPGPYGSRFSTNKRGAWYAGLHLHTAQREVAFHNKLVLEDTRFTGEISFEYQDFMADFAGVYATLDEAEIAECMQDSPVPQCYTAGQALATKLLYTGSNGIYYLSVRDPGGICIVCFRPAMVYKPRRGSQWTLAFNTDIPLAQWIERP